MKKLTDKVAVVTGGGQGIGRGICLELAKEGAKVAVIGRTLEKLQKVVREIENLGSEGLALTADVKSDLSVHKMVEQVKERFGRIDILVNNAAAVHQRPIPEIIEEEWKDTFDTNVYGSHLCTKYAGAVMKEQHYGKIIFVSSTAGLAPVFENESNYSASKAAVLQYASVAMKEYGPYGITVNSIVPGVVDAPCHHAGKTQQQTKAFYDWYASITAVNRVGRPEDVGRLAAFLASEDASYICGATIVIDGGRMDRL